MNEFSATSLLELTYNFLELVISWPVAVVILGLLFRRELRMAMRRVQQVTVGGVQVSLLPALGQLAAREAARETASQPQADIHSIIRREMDAIADVLHTSGEMQPGPFRALWVDDKPSSNDAERGVLEQIGFRFTTALSTTHAQEYLSNSNFELVISDMVRPESRTAGFELLEWMNEKGIQVPYLIYCGHVKGNRERKARDLGALGITSSPNRIVQLALQAVQEPRTRGRTWFRRLR
jgi:CheY-like chemotaxis protein